MHAIYLINFTFHSLVSIVVDVREVAETVGTIAIEGISELIDIGGHILRRDLSCLVVKVSSCE